MSTTNGTPPPAIPKPVVWCSDASDGYRTAFIHYQLPMRGGGSVPAIGSASRLTADGRVKAPAVLAKDLFKSAARYAQAMLERYDQTGEEPPGIVR